MCFCDITEKYSQTKNPPNSIDTPKTSKSGLVVVRFVIRYVCVLHHELSLYNDDNTSTHMSSNPVCGVYNEQ